MTIKYNARHGFGIAIEARTIVSETARRYSWSTATNYVHKGAHKETSYEKLCDTFDEAKKWLILKAEIDVLKARRQLELANARLGNVKGLKAP